jgi:hypothetical protein
VNAGAAPNYSPAQVAVSSLTSALVVHTVTEANGDAEIRGRAYSPTTGIVGAELSLLAAVGTNSAPSVTALTGCSWAMRCGAVF